VLVLVVLFGPRGTRSAASKTLVGLSAVSVYESLWKASKVVELIRIELTTS
jgi:hypothetical protein